jgi:shikimate kinase
MPGSGKTTLGEMLANKLDVAFYDLDDAIQKAEGKSIPEIFSGPGEKYFREIESRLLAEFANTNQSFVLSTGGGAPCFHDGIEIINRTGVSIFLDVPLSLLLQRLKSKTDRPLLSENAVEKEKKLIALREARIACYQKAKIRVENPNLNTLLSSIKNLEGEQV